MTLVQTEPKKICMWGNPPAPIVEYDQGEGTIVVQRRDIFTGTITESGTYTFQAALKSTSNWTSHLILYVNGNETVHFMKAGADGFLGFSKDVTLNSGDSVRIYGYHDLSGEVAYVAGTKLFKAELEPISSGISGTVSTGSPLYAVYNLSNPTPGVYRWNVGSRSNSNGINLYKSINGGAGELIASMTDGSYVDVQVSEGTTSLSLFYSMGSGSSTNISGGSVTVYPDSSSLVEKEIKRVTIRPNGVEKQIRPAVNWNNLDISTATLNKQFSTGYGFQGLYVNPNEDIVLTIQYSTSSGTLRKYSFTNKDISTCTLVNSVSVAGRAHCVFANKTGTHIYIGTHASNTIYEYSTTNWDVTNTVYKSINLGILVQSIWISDDEKYLVVCNPTSSTGQTSSYWLYEMTTPGDVSTAILKSSGSNVFNFNIHGIFFNSDMTKYLVCQLASQGTVYQGNWDILNGGTPTTTHTLAVTFSIGYANINQEGTTMYATNESGYIYQYSLT